MNNNVKSCVSFERDSILRTEDVLYFDFAIANQDLLTHLDIDLKDEIDQISLIIAYSLNTKKIELSKVEIIYDDDTSEVYDVELTEAEYELVHKHINEIIEKEFKVNSEGMLLDYSPLYTDQLSEMVHISDLMDLIKLGRANHVQTNYLENILKNCIKRNETVTEIFNKDTCTSKDRLYIYGIVSEYCFNEKNLNRIVNCNQQHKVNPYLFAGSLTEYIFYELCRRNECDLNSSRYEELLNFISISFEKYIDKCSKYRIKDNN